jgi:hypothetical protein
MRKLTHHETDERGFAIHWISFESAMGVGYHGEGTPPCVRVEVGCEPEQFMEGVSQSIEHTFIYRRPE